MPINVFETNKKKHKTLWKKKTVKMFAFMFVYVASVKMEATQLERFRVYVPCCGLIKAQNPQICESNRQFA